MPGVRILYVGCLKQLGTCPGCKALYSVIDVSDQIVELIQSAGSDGTRKRVLSPGVTNMIGQLFKTNAATAIASVVDSGDEAEIEPVRPAHRLAHVNPEGQTIGYTEEVVLAKAGQPSDRRSTTARRRAGPRSHDAATRQSGSSDISLFPLGSLTSQSARESMRPLLAEKLGRACGHAPSRSRTDLRCNT